MGLDLEGLRRRLEREKAARRQAEEIAEEKSRDLYLKSLELEKALAEESRLKSELERLALTDALTGLDNRRSFDIAARHQVRVAIRHRRPLSLLMLDIDYFKKVNDTYGHAVGDLVLVKVAQVFRQHIRSMDLPARLGGEEFCLLLPETGVNDARLIAERLRLAIAAEEFQVNGQPFVVTVSIGIAACSGEGDSLESLLERSDQALYGAKQTGRNRSELWKGDAAR
jgi:diguanylate cyclase (GGDEF)-like protein